jgi:myosin heavy subunit
MVEKRLINFIIEARRKGFSDLIIRKALLNNKWSEKSVESAFQSFNPTKLAKNQLCIFLSNEVLIELEKRAKKNLMNIEEQIEDILRRSCARKSISTKQEKIDDLLISCFSRQNRGRGNK